MPDVPSAPDAPDKLPSGLPAAFALTGTPSRLPGGQGTCWRVGDAVLKPGQDPAEACWLAEVFADLTGPGFRVPRPVRAVDGSWVVAGWAAWGWVDGEPDELARWPELVEVSRSFHAALAGRGRPRWVGRGASPWAVADRVAWGEATVELAPELAGLVTALLAAMRPVRLPSQLVHGDIAGNVLFPARQSPPARQPLAAGQPPAAGQSPAVIDFSPYWRPPGYALAVAAVDLLAWSDAPPGILDELSGEPEIDQLLLRALVFRVVVESLARDRPADQGRAEDELRAVRRVTQPVTDLLLGRAAVLHSGRDSRLPPG